MAAPRAYPQLTAEQQHRFWQKIQKGPPGHCWLWQRGLKGRGYGALTVNKQPLSAHRVAWELTYGPVAPDRYVYHVVCNTPACCNAAHMTVGSKSDAMQAASNHGTKLGRGTHAPVPPKPRSHYAKPYPKLTEKQARAFWKKVDRRGPDDCWEWTAAGAGYGRFRAAGRSLIASRVSYGLAHGDPPVELDVCHTCDNPRCVNPLHLFLGTRRENMEDCERKGRGNAARGKCAGKTKLTEDQVYEIRRRGDAGESRKLMAEEFGITAVSISNIITRKTWKHLPEEDENA